MVAVYALLVLKWKYLPDDSDKPLIVAGYIDGTSW
jgi:hypothetical protein